MGDKYVHFTLVTLQVSFTKFSWGDNILNCNRSTGQQLLEQIEIAGSWYHSPSTQWQLVGIGSSPQKALSYRPSPKCLWFVILDLINQIFSKRMIRSCPWRRIITLLGIVVETSLWTCLSMLSVGPLFTKPPDVLSPNLAKSRSREIWVYCDSIILKLYRRTDSSATEAPVKL